MRSNATCFWFCLAVGAVQAAGQPAPISDNPEVVILRPAIAFADYKTDAALSAELYGGEAYAGRLIKEAVTRLQKMGIATVDQDTISDPVAREAAGMILADASKFSRGLVAGADKELFAGVSVATNSSHALVLVQNMKVKMGPHAAWSLDYGLLGPQMTITTVQAALISSRTGRAAWQGQAFLRALPGVNSAKFDGLLKDLYKSLTSIPGQTNDR